MGMPLTLPNLITLFRIAMIPLFVIVFYLPFSWANVAATVTELLGFKAPLDMRPSLLDDA